MKKGRIVVLIGRSGCGKDFFMKKLIGELTIKPVVTYTSRPKRDGELNGKDYYFVTKEEFDKMVK
ncbi:MAG: guanylate kinase, partial [Clostridium sp.]